MCGREVVRGGFAVERTIDEVADVREDDGRYSKAGLCGDLEDIEELEYCRLISTSQFVSSGAATVFFFRAKLERSLFAAEQHIPILGADFYEFIFGHVRVDLIRPFPSTTSAPWTDRQILVFFVAFFEDRQIPAMIYEGRGILVALDLIFESQQAEPVGHFRQQ